MRKASINPFSVQNVVYHLLKDSDNMTTLKLNIMLHIINLQYKSAFAEVLWDINDFYDDDGLQKSIWVDMHLGFIPDYEIINLYFFEMQTDNRHCKLPNSLYSIVETVKLLYSNFKNEELRAACFFANIPLGIPVRLFEEKGIISEFKHNGRKIYYITYDSDGVKDILK